MNIYRKHINCWKKFYSQKHKFKNCARANDVTHATESNIKRKSEMRLLYKHKYQLPTCKSNEINKIKLELEYQLSYIHNTISIKKSFSII